MTPIYRRSSARLLQALVRAILLYHIILWTRSKPWLDLAAHIEDVKLTSFVLELDLIGRTEKAHVTVAAAHIYH